ncbi:MAG: asparaginase [Ruminiclostridium sp.]|nr:asparaginase [Ruminiclostridium sp.]
MKQLLMITTGGTIASGNSGGGLAPEKRGEDMLPDIRGISIKVLNLFSVDSTDITVRMWSRLYEAVTDNLQHFDGIIILHGTDTMAYTGALLAFTVKTDKPVIITGSMRPFGAAYGDAEENIREACEKAADPDVHGVWLSFAGKLIPGADIKKLESTKRDSMFSYSGFKADGTNVIPDEGTSFPAVIKLSPFTTVDDILAASGRCGAVIETYGAGGLPAGEITEAVAELAKSIPVIITTDCLGGTDLRRYEVGRRALDAGAMDSEGMSTEAAAVKMWLECNKK